MVYLGNTVSYEIKKDRDCWVTVFFGVVVMTNRWITVKTFALLGNKIVCSSKTTSSTSLFSRDRIKNSPEPERSKERLTT